MKKALARAAAIPDDPTVKFAVDFPDHPENQIHEWGGNGFTSAPLIGVIIAASEGQGVTTEPSMADTLLSSSMQWNGKSAWKKWTTVYCGYDEEQQRWRSFLTDRISLDEFKNGPDGGFARSAKSQYLQSDFPSDRFDLALHYLLALEHISTKVQGNENQGFSWLKAYKPNFDVRDVAVDYSIPLEPNYFVDQMEKAKAEHAQRILKISGQLERLNLGGK